MSYLYGQGGVVVRCGKCKGTTVLGMLWVPLNNIDEPMEPNDASS